MIDGYEQLGWWSRWRLRRWCRRRGLGLLVTAHQDMGLPDLHRTTVTADLAAAVVAGLLRDEQRRRLGEVDLGAELQRQAGNLREVLRALYDRYEAGSRT